MGFFDYVGNVFLGKQAWFDFAGTGGAVNTLYNPIGSYFDNTWLNNSTKASGGFSSNNPNLNTAPTSQGVSIGTIALIGVIGFALLGGANFIKQLK